MITGLSEYITAAFALILIVTVIAAVGTWFDDLLDKRDPSRKFTAWRVATVSESNGRWFVTVKHDVGSEWVWRWQANREARKLNRAHFNRRSNR